MATKTKSASPPPVEYASGMDKIRDEMAKSKSAQITLLGEGLTTMLLLHPEWEENIAQKGKTLDGALGNVRKNAQGGCSDPVSTTKSLIEYYGINCDDPRRLTLEVTAGMMGGGAPAAAGTGDRGTSFAPAGAPAPSGEGFREPQTPAPAPAPVPTAPDPVDPFDLDALLGGLG